MMREVELTVILVFCFVYNSNEISAQSTRYDNHRLYRVKHETEHHATVLRGLKNYLIIDEHDPVNNETYFVVPPHKDAEFRDVLKKYRITRAVVMVKNIKTKMKFSFLQRNMNDICFFRIFLSILTFNQRLMKYLTM